MSLKGAFAGAALVALGAAIIGGLEWLDRLDRQDPPVGGHVSSEQCDRSLYNLDYRSFDGWQGPRWKPAASGRVCHSPKSP